MEFHESCYKEFMNYLRPFGDERLQFLLYGMREKSAGPFRVPDLSGWPHGTELKSFAFTDEHWPVVIELFEFWSSGFMPPRPSGGRRGQDTSRACSSTDH